MPSGYELSCNLWSLAVLGLDPGPAWMHAFTARCEAGVQLFVSGTSAACLLWGLARMRRYPPSPVWMEHFLWQIMRCCFKVRAVRWCGSITIACSPGKGGPRGCGLGSTLCFLVVILNISHSCHCQLDAPNF